MTARGVFGLPQGQRSGASSLLWTPALAKCVNSPGVAPDTDYITLTGYTANGVMVEVTPGLSYPIVIHSYTLSTTLQSNASSVSVRLGTGAAGSEVVRFVGNTNIYTNNVAGSVAAQIITDPYGVYVPANTRIAIAVYFNAASGSPGVVQINYGRTNGVYPLAQSEVASATNITASGQAWYELAATPPLAGGCWVIGHVLQSSTVVGGGPAANLQAIRYGLGPSGSERQVTSYMQPVSNGMTSSGDGSTLWFPPFWWPPGTRLAIAGSASSRGWQGYVFWRSALQ